MKADGDYEIPAQPQRGILMGLSMDVDRSGGPNDGRIYISMAYLEGRELFDIITEGVLPVDRALNLGAQFADGLAEAHSKGVIHRDIKPANLFVTTQNRATNSDNICVGTPSAIGSRTRKTCCPNWLRSLTTRCGPACGKVE